jgi:hypothetical protein
LLQNFEFTDTGTTFSCTIEAPRHAGMPQWWWFSVDKESTTRYAPFAALPDDTKKSVRDRIVAYYAELLAIKARPVHQRPAWTRPERPATPVVEANLPTAAAVD